MTDTPKFTMPKMIDGSPQDFDEASKSHALAAEILWKRERDERNLPLVAPSTYLTCLALELFLKARLLERGYSHKQLGKRELGHNIYKMWMMPEFDELRSHAQKYAEACAQIKPSPIPDPKVQTIDWTIHYLEKLYGNETRHALRYPQGTTKVPYVQPLLWVLADLLDDPKWQV